MGRYNSEYDPDEEWADFMDRLEISTEEGQPFEELLRDMKMKTDRAHFGPTEAQLFYLKKWAQKRGIDVKSEPYFKTQVVKTEDKGPVIMVTRRTINGQTRRILISEGPEGWTYYRMGGDWVEVARPGWLPDGQYEAPREEFKSAKGEG